MEYTVKDKVLALIFPAVCVLYGIMEFRLYLFDGRPFGVAMALVAAPLLAILGGVIIGVISIKLKVNYEPYLKVLTVGTVITWLLFTLITIQITAPVLGDVFHLLILLGSAFLMTVKQPGETPARDRLLLTFANPVMYSLLNKLLRLLVEYLYKAGALVR